MSWFQKRTENKRHLYVEERLSAYLDGELTPQEQTSVQQHLESCPACQWNLDSLQQTVQWTRELPTVPVPRVFTIPVPAQPRRVPQRTWGLPMLQGATALVALLLAFVVAGDFLLTGVRPLPAPGDEMLLMEAPAESQPTVWVEKEVQAIAETMVETVIEAVEVEAETVIETVAVEVAVEAPQTVAVEEEVVVEVTLEVEKAVEEPPAAPAPRAAEPTATESIQDAVAAPVEGESSTAGVVAFASPSPEAFKTSTEKARVEEASAEADRTAAPEPTPEPLATSAPPLAAEAPRAEEPAVGGEGAEPPATALTLPGTAIAAADQASPEPSPTPTLVPTLAPTIVAEARDLAVPQPERPAQTLLGLPQDALALWFVVAEVVLGVTFVLMVVATVVFMVRRRRMG
jgi:anti-sigma factor RsiW